MDLAALIDRYDQAWNDQDVETIMSMHAPDMVFENHTRGVRVHGEAVRKLLEDTFAAQPDLRFRGRRRYVGDDFVVSEWTATATDDEGRKIEWDGVDVFPFRDGLIARKDVYSSSHAPRVVGSPPAWPMSRENVDVVRRAFEAAARGDSAAVLALYHPQVEWDARRTASGVGDVTVLVHGHDGLRAFFRRWREVWESDEYDYEELIDAGDVVISVGTQRGRGQASGVQVKRPLIGVWTIRDGLILRVVWFPTREEALEAAGLSV